MKPRLALAVLLMLVALAAACGEDGASEGKVTVVATTTHVGDLLARVGGDRVNVEQILEPGADPHGYEPRPSDAAAIAEAALVLRSGGEVDGWLDDLISNAGGDAEVIELIDSVDTIEGGHEHEHGDDEEAAEDAATEEDVDPHWWLDPRNAILAVEAIRDALIAVDPDGRAGYERRARSYIARLEQLDARIARCLGRLPPERRKLVSAHDSLGYFAHRYDLEAIGAVIPSLSTQAQPSARDIDDLVHQLEREEVRAVFPESEASERLESALAREAGVEVGDPLWTDSLGGDGSGAETYVDAMSANADAIAAGLSGGRLRCGRSVRSGA